MDLKYELQNLISGVGNEAEKNLIQSTADYLRKSKKASGKLEKTEHLTKVEETKGLVSWIDKNDLWFKNHDETRYITQGAEQKIFLDVDERYVYKLNDSIFYEYWIDYFNSLLLHNYFFPQTRYWLLGFLIENNDRLYSVVQQPFIEITQPTDRNEIKSFLEVNGFFLKKNNDYYNPRTSIILEDLHEENVLTNNGVLFFIDTVFYLAPDFFDAR